MIKKTKKQWGGKMDEEAHKYILVLHFWDVLQVKPLPPYGIAYLRGYGLMSPAHPRNPFEVAAATLTVHSS